MPDDPSKKPDVDATAPLTVREAPVDPLIGKTIDGRFTPRALLGRGGMGSVYLAEDSRLKRRVALKLMGAGLADDAEFAQRFKREALVQAQASHPGIVQVLDAGDCPEGAYMVLEYSEGRSLSSLLKVGPMRRERAVSLVEQLLDVLDFAHRQGIVHRDLKPGNILIEDRGGREIVRVLDFGIAKLLRTEVAEEGQTLTKTGFGFGTPGYMSLEQATGRPTDHRTDIYAAGVILYQMLGGVLPLAATSMSDYLVKLAATDPRPLGELLPELGVPPALDDAIMKALAREPDDRYASALHFLEALREFRRNEDAPTGATYAPRGGGASVARKPTPSKRTGGGVVMTAIALLAFGGGAAVGKFLLGDAEATTLRAEEHFREGAAKGEADGRAQVRDVLRRAGVAADVPENAVAEILAGDKSTAAALAQAKEDARRYEAERDREKARADDAERDLASARSDAASASREAAALRDAAGRPDGVAEGLRADIATVRTERDDYRKRLGEEETLRRAAETSAKKLLQDVERVEAELSAARAAAERSPAPGAGDDSAELAELKERVKSLTLELDRAKSALAAAPAATGGGETWRVRLENASGGSFDLKDLTLVCKGPRGDVSIVAPALSDPRILAGKTRTFDLALPGPILRAEGRVARIRPGGAVAGTPEPFRKSEFAIRDGEVVLSIK